MSAPKPKRAIEPGESDSIGAWELGIVLSIASKIEVVGIERCGRVSI